MAERAMPVLALLSLGVVAFQQVKLGNYPPPPAAFVGVAVVYSLLAVLALASPQLAAAFGAAVIIWLVFAYRGQLSPASTSKGGALPASQ